MSEKLKQRAQDLYRDMRDRRLLVVAAALIVAIIAVPLLVKGEPAPEPSATFSAASEPAPSELDPVVLTEGEKLRNYRTRLDGLHSRNPFKQQLTAPPPSGGSGSGDGGGLPTEETVTGSTGTEAAVGGTATSSTSTSTSVPETPDGGPPTTDPDAGVDEEEGETVVATFTVDVKIGPRGEARRIRDVEVGDRLPGDNRPLVQYLGAEFDASAASFALSRQVDGASGEGKCLPRRATCDFLELEVGEEQELETDRVDGVHRIKLLAVERHERPLSRDQSETE